MTQEITSRCPYCGEPVEIVVDPGGARLQRYVEDCPVCCRPWNVEVTLLPEGDDWTVELHRLDD
jgi:transposase-like protein